MFTKAAKKLSPETFRRVCQEAKELSKKISKAVEEDWGEPSDDDEGLVYVSDDDMQEINCTFSPSTHLQLIYLGFKDC
jgi:hypothetical protein